MTLGYKDITQVAGRFFRCMLPVCVLIVLGSCAGTNPPVPPVVPTGSTPSDQTESQLLAELNKKFENPQVHYDLARVYHKSQNWNKAEYHYNVALGFDPSNRAAQAGLVKRLRELEAPRAKTERRSLRSTGDSWVPYPGSTHREYLFAILAAEIASSMVYRGDQETDFADTLRLYLARNFPAKG